MGNEGKSDFSLKLSSATRQRLRFSAAQPQFLPLLLASTSSSSSSPSPVYTLMHETLTWSEASAACQAAGQHLASVQSAAENALLVTAAAGNRVWIGGTDAASEGTCGCGARQERRCRTPTGAYWSPTTRAMARTA